MNLQDSQHTSLQDCRLYSRVHSRLVYHPQSLLRSPRRFHRANHPTSLRINHQCSLLTSPRWSPHAILQCSLRLSLLICHQSSLLHSQRTNRRRIHLPSLQSSPHSNPLCNLLCNPQSNHLDNLHRTHLNSRLNNHRYNHLGSPHWTHLHSRLDDRLCNRQWNLTPTLVVSHL